MGEPEPKQIYANALPLLAVVLMASGIAVKTLPLESKRPADPERAKFSHAGRQDVQARLWEDPFAALRHVQGASPKARCDEAMKDRAHHPSALTKSLQYQSGPRANRAITVLPVLVPGGPYFEDGEARRRTRYAVLMALFNAGWTPVEEDKLGYVWTFESCIESPWQRRAPEVLPYEWLFSSNESAQPRAILILWIDEHSVDRRPLRGIETVVERLALGGVPCRAAEDALVERLESEGIKCADPGPAEGGLRAPTQGCGWPDDAAALFSVAGRHRPVPWCDTRVIGPSTSASLLALVNELVDESAHGTSPSWLRFYSAGATAHLDDARIGEVLRSQWARGGPRGPSPSPGSPTQPSVEQLQARFGARVVRLTTTDDKLVEAFAKELEHRLADPTPFWRISRPQQFWGALCGDSIVLVSEGDSSYARLFRQEFETKFPKFTSKECGEIGAPEVRSFGYLRGLDGVLPEGGSAQASTPGQPGARSPTTRDAVLDQATLERADGRSQYDYLRRLAGQLAALDQRERHEGRNGVRAIGVLGNDAYDKILVLDALRDRFPKAVFFAADLDARLMSAAAVGSTRNLFVASAYGLTLNPGIQGAAPPFRDTYQSGVYLAARVAVDRVAQDRPSVAFAKWFEKPRLFEIGRTRAIALSPGAKELCARPDPEPPASTPGASDPGCPNVHDFVERPNFGAWPGAGAAVALVTMLATAAGLALLFSPRARAATHTVWRGVTAVDIALVVGAPLVLVGAFWVIVMDARSGHGEPFAWLEGVSVWPTQILRLVILIVTVALLVYGRRQLVRNVDKVAEDFHVQTLKDRECAPRPTAGGATAHVEWLRRLRAHGGEAAAAASTANPWEEFLDCLRLRASSARVAVATLLFFAFGVALISLDWPTSPHRGWVSAWVDHGLQLLVFGGMMALLFTALDCSAMATRLLARLDPLTDLPESTESPERDLRARYPVSERAFRLWKGFRFAARVASAVNRFIYLPFLALLLIVPTRSRVFDAWDFPLPYVALLLLSVALAVLCALRLRRAAGDLRARILDDLEREAESCALEARLPPREPVAPPGAPAAKPDDAAPLGVAPQIRADLLKRIVEQIRTSPDGPFRPLSQEPVMRAIMIVLGGTGGIATAEFLFLSRM